MVKTMSTMKLLAALLLPMAQTTAAFAPAASPPPSHRIGRPGPSRKRPSSASARDMSPGGGKGFGAPEEDMTPPSSVSKPRTPPSASSAPLGGGEFEMQEMKFQLRGMLKKGIPSRALLPEKREELASYVRATAMRVPSPVPPGKLAEPGKLNGTWRLAFSTEAATLGDLPREANVLIRFKDDRKVDYVLEFTKKVWGLEGITAASDYMVDPGPLNPGLVTMVYDKITANMFGKTVPTGLFGMLKGRANYIETVWFDGDFWIDRGFGPDGTEYFNVFVKDDGTWGKMDGSVL